MESAEQPPGLPPPRRRRRRWLIVALLLVLVSGVAWWNGPRGDARFVGKWAAHTLGRAKPEATMILRPNGSCVWLLPPGQKGSAQAAYTIWQVDEQDLRFGLKASGSVNSGIISVQEWINAHCSPQFMMNENPWEIVSVSADVVELVRAQTKNTKRPITMTLRRIPE